MHVAWPRGVERLHGARVVSGANASTKSCADQDADARVSGVARDGCTTRSVTRSIATRPLTQALRYLPGIRHADVVVSPIRAFHRAGALQQLVQMWSVIKPERVVSSNEGSGDARLQKSSVLDTGRRTPRSPAHTSRTTRARGDRRSSLSLMPEFSSHFRSPLGAQPMDDLTRQ